MKLALPVLVLAAVTLMGCSREPTAPEYVARVGDQTLTQEELSNALPLLRPNVDTSSARQQFIEQWVTTALLYQEARRRDLAKEPDVQKRLREQERAVLVNELTNRLYDSFSPAPSKSEIRAYYERHREQLRLRQPYVRIRYLSTTNINTAREVRNELVQFDDNATSDSLWTALVEQHAADPEEAHQLAITYHPTSHLFGHRPLVRQQLDTLEPGQTAPLVRGDSLVHVLQLVDRATEGTLPELNWVEDEIRRRLVIRARKQMYAREVQRLRNEARARDELDIR